MIGVANQVSLPFEGLRLLAVSPVEAYGGHNTSIQRVKAFESLGCRVGVLNTAAGGLGTASHSPFRNRLFRLGLPVPLADPAGHNQRLLALLREQPWDILWLEKSLTIGRNTLATIRDRWPHVKIVGFGPDDMNARHNQSLQFLRALPLYDAFVTTKSFNVAELRNRGCPRVIFVGNGYDPDTSRPLSVSKDDVVRVGGEVGFIGTYERERAEFMYDLAAHGLEIRVWGGSWEGMKSSHPNLRLERAPLYGDDFARACAAFKVNLAFLRKMNRDLQTTRSVEIPACGGFMLAERTREHLDLFEEGTEAEYFDTWDEALEKCKRYLREDAQRAAIAKRGYERCLRSGYDNASRMRDALTRVLAE
jgi:hypothetical protein